MTRSIVVLSGGMDSTAALCFVANEHPGEVKAVSFNYGQRHVKEILAAQKICNEMDIQHKIIDLRSVNDLLAGSALTDETVEVPEGHYEEATMRATVVPNRNSIMLNIAAAWAVSEGATRVVTGVHAGDHAVYPDCRPEFIDALNDLLMVANDGFINVGFRVYAPWIGCTKTDIILTCEDEFSLDVPWHLTWTCYKGGDKHCGRCSTCVERLEAFDLAGHEDPVEYVDREYYKQVILDRLEAK